VSGAPNLPAGFTGTFTSRYVDTGELRLQGPGNTMKLAADDVQTLVIPGCAHWVAEQAPDQLLAALTTFLAPYRDGMAAE
jgi:pimeloyl-ACP methyl ester carboxylesterase